MRYGRELLVSLPDWTRTRISSQWILGPKSHSRPLRSSCLLIDASNVLFVVVSLSNQEFEEWMGPVEIETLAEHAMGLYCAHIPCKCTPGELAGVYMSLRCEYL